MKAFFYCVTIGGMALWLGYLLTTQSIVGWM